MSGTPSKNLAGFWDFRTKDNLAKPNNGVSCPRCGMTLIRFHATHRVGCSDCDQVFRDAILRSVTHFGDRSLYVGKIPTLLSPLEKNSLVPSTPGKRPFKCLSHDDQVKTLFSHLELAITEERYEDAAKIRDRIATCDRRKVREPANNTKRHKKNA
jgi:protein-arginine kinase activator protein McsA